MKQKYQKIILGQVKYLYNNFCVSFTHLLSYLFHIKDFCIHSTFVNDLTVSIKKMDERDPSVFDIQNTVIFISQSLKKLNSLVG